MRLVLAAALFALSTAAFAHGPPSAPSPDEAKVAAPVAQPVAPKPPAQPDPNKEVTITLAKLQTIISAAQAEASLKCLAPVADGMVRDLIRQATPAEPAK